MKLTRWSGLMMAAAFAAGATAPARSMAQYVAHATISAPVGVRVWVDGADVFPDYGHVTLWLRADRDCYSSLFLVDTAGYIHVLNLGAAYDNGWVYGGRTYGYRGCDLGLDRLDGRGIAYVFAVGSPVPFDYSYYGAGVCVNGFGFRVAGDPFVASREFYMSILPANCRWDCVGVSFTRFYVHDWVRYPAYLCSGGPAHVHVGDACPECANAYASYRCNVASPYDALLPRARYRDYPGYNAGAEHIVRFKAQSDRRDGYAPITPARASDLAPMVKETRRFRGYENMRVISTSGDVERAPRPDVSRSYAPVAVRNSRPQVVAFKGRGAIDNGAAHGMREKDAHRKVRQAE